MNDTTSAHSGSGTYQFLALTSGTMGGSQAQAQTNIYQNTLSHHRRPNYSNEDIVDDLNRCSGGQIQAEDVNDYDLEDEEYYQLQSLGQVAPIQNEEDFEDDDQNFGNNMEVIQEGGSRDESGTHRSPQGYTSNDQPMIEEVEEVDTLKYLNYGHQKQVNGTGPINIEDQAHVSQRIQFSSQTANEVLEETHDFPQVEQNLLSAVENNDSIIDNQFLDIPHSLRQQLYVACIIKKKEKKSETNIVSARSVSQPRSARNSQVQKSQSLQEKCHFGKTSIESERENKPKQLGFFTTQSPSGYLLKFNKNPGMTFEEATQIMHTQENLSTFLQAFETDKSLINVFGFDSCINELQGHRLLSLNNEVVKFLSESTSYRLMSFKDSLHGSMGHSSGDLSEKELQANDFVFIFGQYGSNKGDILNVHKPESLMNRFIDTIQENVRYLKVSMFYQDQEYIIGQKNYHQSSINGQKRELAMDLRQAHRTRLSIIKKYSSMNRKVVSEQEKLSKEMRVSSHLVIQINNRIFVDLGGIESLNSQVNPSIVQNLTVNFGSVTNQILKLSPFYANHDFNSSDYQENSAFNMFLKNHLNPQSRISLLCCVTSDPKLTPQTLIALDYCHKIKCYFNGITEEDVKTRILQDAQSSNDGIKQIRMREIGKLYEQFWMIKAGKERSRGRSTTSPRRELNIEIVREQALIRSRMSDDPNGSMVEEKRFVTILLKQIETFIASNPRKLSVTPIKTLQHNKSHGHLRMRTTSGSRSTTSLQAPMLVFNNSHIKKQGRVLNLTVTESFKPRSQSRQVHRIPNVVQDIIKVRRSLSRQSKNSEASSRSRSPFIHHQKYSSKNSISSKVGNGNPSVLIHDQRQNFCIDASIYDDYQQNIVKANETLQADSRDTPQFQQDSLCHQFNNSSLYLRTSAASSLKFNKRHPSAKRSDFNSIPTNGLVHQTCGIQSDIYCETSEKKSSSRHNRRQVLSSGQKDRKLSSSRARQSLLQESIRQLEDEQENSLKFSNVAFVPGGEKLTPKYMKAVNETQIKEIVKLRDQIREVEEHAERVKRTTQRRVEELRAQIQDKDKIIESLEYQVEGSRKEMQRIAQELQKTKAERDTQYQTNSQIIQQITQMKAVVEDFKESEKEKEQLLLKIKQKDEMIRELQKLNKSPRDMDTQKMKEELKRLSEENEKLKAFQSEKIDTMDSRFQQMFTDYKNNLEENQRLQEDVKAFEDKLKQIEKAKENYKDHTLELKSEVKQLKAQLHNRTVCSSTKYGEPLHQDSSSIIRDFENSQSIEEEMITKQRDKQKEAVLGDIRNLIQEYKRDRKIAPTQVRL